MKKDIDLTQTENEKKMELSRRNFLIGSALGLGGALLPGVSLAANVLRCDTKTSGVSQVTAPVAAEAAAPCLVYIFLRGAMDGLSMVAPSRSRDAKNYKIYQAARPDLAVTEGLQLGSSNLMLHHNLPDLFNLYQKNKLAVIHGIGSPNNTRSHFDQMNFIESGTPVAVGSLSRQDGFLNRILAASGADIQAASMQSVLPRNINGVNPAVALNGSLNRFVQMSASGVVPGLSLTDRILGLFTGTVDPLLCQPAATSSLAIRRAQAIVASSQSWTGISPQSSYAPAGVYSSGLGASLRETARLLKGSPGTRVVSIDVAGWDTHYNMGVQEGTFSRLMLMVNHALATFQADLESLGLAGRVVTVVMTEFGRTFAQNGSLGLDHGRGSAMLVMGAKVKGGAYTRDWDLSRLEDNRDLRVTVDYRDVLGQVVQSHLRGSLAQAFPGYTLNTSGVKII